MSPYIPALNEIPRQALGHEPQYPDAEDERMYIILFPEDHEGHGIDFEGNVAMLLDCDQAAEVRDLAADIVEELDAEERQTSQEEQA